MLSIEKKVKVIEGCKPDQIPEHILTSQEPIILKGLVAQWPVVKAGLMSDTQARQYIAQFYQGQSVAAFLGDPANGGRIFYNEGYTGYNYQTVSTKLDFALDQFAAHSDNQNPPTIYIGSTTIDTYLPGFRAENDLALDQLKPLVSIWLSNKCRIAAHWDSPTNIACSVIGHRRFTLFPPEQLENLYVGPLDKTPAGQAISSVDFYAPDFEQFPKFREALLHAQVADLEPGDALLLPSMWWHHVESLSSFNVLVNYWMRDLPAYFGAGMNALEHAILSIRGLPESQREVWKNLFNHYVFDYEKENFQHIPAAALGSLGDITDDEARKIRASLLSKLNR